MTGKELRRIRKRLGWTQKQLAEAVGIAPNALAMQERGEIGISEPVSRLVLLVAGGVDIEAIINPHRSRKDAPRKPPKGVGPRHSKGTNRQKNYVQGKRRRGIR